MNNTTWEQRARQFRNLHQQPGIFVTPNPWDAGSARVLEALGFKALATTSAGLAYSLGKPDGHSAITREETLRNAQSIIQATSLPVSADLENGFGDDPAVCAATILLAAEAGLAGGSIEDATGNPADPIYPFELAVERVKAAVEAASSLSTPFTLTARAENLIRGRLDLKDTINRLVAFADAGADVLFAPGLKTAEEITAVVKAVAPRPVNVIMGISGMELSLDMLQQLGIKRVSVGSSVVRAAYGAFFRAAEEILRKGTFSYADDAKPYADLNELFGRWP
ncbi:isocitrate lyase/phosphoenolpyruvate mutase family protein [Chitinophaga agrisoli]|uniref:Isocitrate lyase/phosphoenolpyruvate mutase family protein n=1 Tax=Chitinophaga agrisoli TaxID=2607653 RepID=A0A5B2VYQ5_9BACT|nr:isocitrate lyase/phosphoenolpyruvate mutase family protein [Chitinophaga agrisoli]KAA2243327.1 isocitrate lyase/phosphoenolpyruvate mutase family protein [Chitinophaga agrisoli]